MKKILVVDDSGDLRSSLVDSLQSLFPDAKILEAQDGVEAKDRLEECLADEPLDTLITDYEMPKMNGLELAQLVRNNPAFSNLPIVMMSGIIGERAHALRAISRDLGCSFLEKPFRREDLRLVLSRIQ